MESQFVTKLLPYLQHKNLSNTVAGLLLVLLCSQLAGITWMLVPSGEDNASWQPERNTASEQKQAPMGIADLLKLHVFGEADKVKTPSRKPTTPTATVAKLNVQLSGVVSSSDPSSSLAIIENRGKQETYGIGETIKGTQAKISEVLSDRVIVDNRGKSQFIMLDGTEESFQPQTQARPKKKPKSIGKQGLRKRVDELRKNPGKLTDYLRISPVRKDGEMKGYRINPGKERLLFTEFDLKPNDLAVAFNGFDLKDSSQAMSVMKELSSLTEASITVERDGQLHDIFIQLP